MNLSTIRQLNNNIIDFIQLSNVKEHFFLLLMHCFDTVCTFVQGERGEVELTF